MTTIKTIQQQKMLKKYRTKYNPNKKLQYVFMSRKYYFKHIKEEYIDLFKLILAVLGVTISAPIIIIWRIKDCLLSLLPYSLVYTKKHLKDDPLVVQPKIKEGE